MAQSDSVSSSATQKGRSPAAAVHSLLQPAATDARLPLNSCHTAAPTLLPRCCPYAPSPAAGAALLPRCSPGALPPPGHRHADAIGHSVAGVGGACKAHACICSILVAAGGGDGRTLHLGWWRLQHAGSQGAVPQQLQLQQAVPQPGGVLQAGSGWKMGGKLMDDRSPFSNALALSEARTAGCGRQEQPLLPLCCSLPGP